MEKVSKWERERQTKYTLSVLRKLFPSKTTPAQLVNTSVWVSCPTMFANFNWMHYLITICIARGFYFTQTKYKRTHIHTHTHIHTFSRFISHQIDLNMIVIIKYLSLLLFFSFIHFWSEIVKIICNWQNLICYLHHRKRYRHNLWYRSLSNWLLNNNHEVPLQFFEKPKHQYQASQISFTVRHRKTEKSFWMLCRELVIFYTLL